MQKIGEGGTAKDTSIQGNEAIQQRGLNKVAPWRVTLRKSQETTREGGRKKSSKTAYRWSQADKTLITHMREADLSEGGGAAHRTRAKKGTKYRGIRHQVQS